MVVTAVTQPSLNTTTSTKLVGWAGQGGGLGPKIAGLQVIEVLQDREMLKVLGVLEVLISVQVLQVLHGSNLRNVSRDGNW